MPIAAILGWIQVSQAAITAGIATADIITGWIRQMHAQQMSDAELNQIITVILNEAQRRKDLALADAKGA